MKVIDHAPAAWFLVQDDTRLLLDVNCSHGAASYAFLLELNEAEEDTYASQGREFIMRLADSIQYSAPGVRGNTSPYRDRNVTGAKRQQVDDATMAWLEKSGHAP